MSHKSQLENKKYRNWVRAGLGLKYVKEGLEPFCEHLVNQQHIAILDKVKRKHNLSAVSCGLCDVPTLQPDHLQTKDRQCPLGQKYCNCLHSRGKTSCPNNVCGAIYDEIIQLHALTPPAPYWNNTDAKRWCTEPWAIARCFVNAPGYDQKTRADEFDCQGLLHLLMNNIQFLQHIKCVMTGTDVFSRVRKSRNDIFHSDSMELEGTEVNSFIDDMIELLEDEIEIKHRQESKDAVKNLLELKQNDFIITTSDEAEIRRVAMVAIKEKERELEQKIVDAENELRLTAAVGKHELEGKRSVIKSELGQIEQNIREVLLKKENEIRATTAEGKHDIEGKSLDIKSELEQTRQKIRDELLKKENEIRITAAESKNDIEGEGLNITAVLMQTRTKIGTELMKKEDEIRTTASEAKRNIERKSLDIKSELEQTRQKIRDELLKKENEIRITAAESKNDIEGEGLNITAVLMQTRKKIRTELMKKEDEIRTTASEAKRDIERKSLDIKSELEQTRQKIRDELLKKENEIRITAAESKNDIEGEGLNITAVLMQTRKKIRTELMKKEDEIRTTASEAKRDIERKSLVIKAMLEQTAEKLEQKGTEIEQQVTMKGVEAKENLEQKLQESKLELERKNKVTLDNLEHKYPSQSESRNSNTDKNLPDDSITDDTHSRQEAENSKKKAGGSEKVIDKTPDFMQRLFRRFFMPREMKDFQKKLVKRYENYVKIVSPVPLQPHRNKGNVSDVYVPPWMTVEIKNEGSSGWKEVQISMHEIFRNKKKLAKNIYVIGDAGTGKSMLSKMLVHCWCIAHSHKESNLDKSYILTVEEIKSFKFLFYVSLRHFSDCDSIEKMLEKSYCDPALGDILQNESKKCLIVLDGLDEWTPESKHDLQFLTPGLPGRELDADYTIITTSRQWKFDTLQISDSEVDTKIKLRGIDLYQMKCFTDKTVKMLNDNFQQSKNAEKCTNDLKSRRVSDISHIPLMLQQLICLWFDDKLKENSKYAIYSNMLVLFFEWNALKKTSKHHECEIITQTRMNDSPLPDYLCAFKTLRRNISVIQYLSQLAFETLFDKIKETSLTFSNLALERLNIPNDVIKNCLDIGILTEEQNVRLLASTRQQSLFSFFHKSVQEYFAAVYVASQLKEMLKSRKSFQKDSDDLVDVCKACVRKYFSSCETVVDILDQSNVLIMLCGLEPQLLTYVSEYIYDITLVDKLVVEERNTLPEKVVSLNHHNLIKDIQTCISICIEEVMPSAKNIQTPVYIADIYVSHSTDFLRYCKYVIINNVLSIDIDIPRVCMKETDSVYLAVKHLGKCDQLKAIQSNSRDDKINNEITKILDTNVSTLETVSLLQTNKIILTHVVSILPKMQRLTSLQMKSINLDRIQHDVCLSLCTYLNQTTSLQQIAFKIKCEKYDEHMIDLSKHKQLQHIDLMFSSFCMVSCNTDRLETCKLSVRSVDIMNQVFNILYNADKLKHFELSDYLSVCYNESVTESLIRLLPSLVSLSTLTLRDFTFTDNFIARPCDMKSLKEITLRYVRMRLTTWCKFIDSLPALPQEITVKTSVMNFTDGTIFGNRIRDKKEAAARQYVREKTNIFRVTRDKTYHFNFTTKNV
ncbi:uncharacterized protein LOC123556425 [Mercenaria mercenaria]|uniref:uncharacterized protein LOC123556425 n=1 Tax=Mercenaria mercenaria TaxID=6596 RepID=UPI00234E45CC|nr:uncharacterized protein LOC123556425 [Mercenaria mercenaria]